MERASSQTRGRGLHRAESIESLESVGFISRGDTKLLDRNAQELYYKKIVHRFMNFCSAHSNDLDTAFRSLPKNRSDDPTKNPPVAISAPPSRSSFSKFHLPHRSGHQTRNSQANANDPASIQYNASKELSTLLLSLRKLREALLATSSQTDASFSRRVHIFCIRTGLLAQHPPSYYPPLRHLMQQLDSRSNFQPLDASESKEFVTYLILDYACRQDDLAAAFALRAKWKEEFGYQSNLVNDVLRALLHGNWILFWRCRNHADGYSKALLEWAADGVRRRALKAVGKSYLQADVRYIVETCAGEEGSWEKLAEKEQLGWRREDDKILIKVRRKPAPTAPAAAP